jgi:hypothetical protein
MKNGLRYFKAFDGAQFPILVLAYTSFLILITDCYLFFVASKSLTLSWKYLALYTFFSNTLWMLVTAKGLAREQLEVYQSGRWQILDILPGSCTTKVVFSSLGQMSKSLSFWIWYLSALTASSFFLDRFDLLASVLVPILIVFGHTNFVLIQTICLWLSPKNYASIFQNLVFSVLFLISGASIPIFSLIKTKDIQNVLPTSTLVSIPIDLLLKDSSAKIGFYASTQPLIFAIGWTILLYSICSTIESVKKERFYE